MYDNLFIVIVSGLINMGCFWLGVKSRELRFREESYPNMVTFDDEPEEKTQKTPQREIEVIDVEN